MESRPPLLVTCEQGWRLENMPIGVIPLAGAPAVGRMMNSVSAQVVRIAPTTNRILYDDGKSPAWEVLPKLQRWEIAIASDALD
jgi:hypothetical protein